MAKILNRADHIWGDILRARDLAGVSIERARLFTESWKTTDGNPIPIRRGMAMKHVLENIPLYIDDRQLIVGSYSSKPMWGEWYPEYETKFLLGNVEDQPALKAMALNGAQIDEIQEIARYWKNISVEDQFLRYIKPEDYEQLELLGENGAFISAWLTARCRHGGYYIADIEKVVKKGYRGVIAEIDAELENTHVMDHETLRKFNNLTGWKIALEGAIAYGRRCAQLCRDTAAETADAGRKAELLGMAAVCDQVPENPARTFHEALQATYFAQIFIYLETRGDGVSPGRADQYLYPCFKSDMEKGTLTEEKAIELLQCFRIKFNTFRQLTNKTFFRNTSGEAQFHNITLGGTDGDGNPAVNALSYLFLEAAMRLRIPHPTLSFRYYDGVPEDFMDKALQVVALGGGYPAFFNDEANIDCLIRYGVTPEDARGYALGGCVQAMPAGKTAPGYPAFMNIAKCLELALHDGFDHYITKKQIGPHTGKFADFGSYDAFYEAFKTQVVENSRIPTIHNNIQRAYRDDCVSAAFTDALIDGCIQSGMTSSGSGAKYNLQYHNAIGVMDVIDSLAAVKKCVFEDKTVDQNILEDALISNFKGYEDVRQILLDAPKYGNDDDYADSIAYDVYHWYANMINETFDAGFGTHYLPGAYSVGIHVGCGHSTGALPDGRYEDDPLADGSMSPCQGSDFCGPTAVLNSADKIDQSELISTLLNMKFQGSTLKNDEDRAKLAALIRAYFSGSGKHIQFNVVDKETLVDAQKAPEKHRDLLVRVAGYSAFFVELIPNLQNEIIARTENSI